MVFSPEQFKSNLQAPAKTSNFEVRVTSPVYSTFAERDMSFKIESVEFPGRSAATADYRLYGTLQKVAYNTIYQDLTMSVIVSSDYKEVEYWNGWFDEVVGTHRTNNYTASGAASSFGFDVNYLNDYASKVNIVAFDDYGNETRNCELIDAYPIIVNPIALNWNSTEIVRLNVTMTYRYWKDVQVQNTSSSTGIDVQIPDVKQKVEKTLAKKIYPDSIMRQVNQKTTEVREATEELRLSELQLERLF
tara:strand:- start:228 stop:968 length:741 start_codon:yes stop_codon:yes gene_type:complete